MTFYTQVFEPSNIMRYITVYNNGGKTEISVDWRSLITMISLNNIPIHPDIFKGACLAAINKHICEVFQVPKNKPGALKTMPYMVALVIFETTKIILQEDIKQSVPGDIGDETVDQAFRSDNEKLEKSPDGKLLIEKLE